MKAVPRKQNKPSNAQLESRLSLISLGVRDLEQSRAFYSEGLGFDEAPESNEYIVFYRMQSFCLALYPSMELARDIGIDAHGAGFRQFTLSYNVAERHEVDKVLKIAEAAGALIAKAPSVTSWGGYAGYFADLDGFYWEVATGSFLDPVD